MAKKILSTFNTDVANVGKLADRPSQTAAQLKAVFDAAGGQIQTEGNETIAELQSSALNTSGAHAIGLGVTGITADNVAEGISEVLSNQTTLDGQNIKLTGNQTIFGVKTFVSSPIVPTPTTDMQISTKKYVDDGLGLKANQATTYAKSETYTKSEVDTLQTADVKLTGTQTIAGAKTFSSNPIVPAPLSDLHATTKKYVDDGQTLDVKLSGNQTINGIKTFNSSPIVPSPTMDTQVATKKYVDDYLTEVVAGSFPPFIASSLPILDAGGYFTGANVETALQEVAAELVDSQISTHAQTLASIQSLPVGTVDGVVIDVEIEGLSLVNSVVNGDFSGGTTGWGANLGVLSVSNKILTITGDGTGATVGAQKTTQIKAVSTDKLFIYSKERVTNSSAVSTGKYIYASVSGGASIGAVSPIANTWYENYAVITGLSGAVYFKLQHVYADAATANGKVMEVDGNAGVHAINMTALGIEDFTEAQMLDLVRSGYIDGLQSLYRPVVQTVGKNLFDKTKVSDGFYVNASTGVLVSNTSYFTSDFVKVKPSISYFMNQGADSGTAGLAWYDANKNFISGEAIGVSVNVLKTSPANASYLRFCGNKGIGGNIETCQIEEGATATPYEPHKSSQLTLDIPLRSLPNGVADRVYEADGQMWLEKNIVEYALLSGDITNLITSYTTLDYVAVLKPTAFIGYGNTLEHIGTQIVYGFTNSSVAGYDLATNIGKSINQAEPTKIYLGITKGTYASLAAAQAALAGTKIHYQLATPQLINLTEEGLASGELMSFEGGTVYNSSDTFHSPLVTFDVPTNRSAQIDSLLESANAQAKQIEAKASKVQEDWIEPTLLNGWVNFGSTTDDVAGYMKDDFGYVHLKGKIKSGTITAGTTLFTLFTGYRPLLLKHFPVTSNNAFGVVYIDTSGNIKIQVGSATYLSLEGISFKVVE